MKKSLTIALCFLFCGIGVNAQTIYIRGGAGIAVTTAAGISTTSQYSSDMSLISTTAKKTGMGTGVPIVLAAGYNFNSNFGIEVGIDYLAGFSQKNKHETPDFSIIGKQWGQMLSLVPALFITFPSGKFSPYARLGLKLGIFNRVILENEAAAISSQLDDVTMKSKDYGGVAIGVQAAVGTDYNLNDRISIFGEIQLDGISYSPAHGKFTVYNVGGVDRLDDMTTREKTWNYVKEIDYTSNIPSDQPDERLMGNNHFGNVGFILGIKFRFSNTKSDKATRKK